MKIKTEWQNVDLEVSRKLRRRNKQTKKWYFKNQNRVRIRRGDSLIILLRLESFYEHFVKNESSKIGLFVLSKDKIELDSCKYLYIYITGKIRLLIRKVWIDDYELVKTTKEVVKNRTNELHWYNIHFSKSKHIQYDTINGLYTDVYYSFRNRIEKECRKLSNTELLDKIDKHTFIKSIGRNSRWKQVVGHSRRRGNTKVKMTTKQFNRIKSDTVKWLKQNHQ